MMGLCNRHHQIKSSWFFGIRKRHRGEIAIRLLLLKDHDRGHKARGLKRVHDGLSAHTVHGRVGNGDVAIVGKQRVNRTGAMARNPRLGCDQMMVIKVSKGIVDRWSVEMPPIGHGLDE